MATKHCSSCDEDVPVENFFRLARSKDGLSGICKECDKRKNRAWRKASGYRQTFTPEQWATRNDTKLKYRYGLTRDEIDAIVVEQGGCAICPATTPGGKNWHVDHDHSCCPGQTTCGKCVRGVLCGDCNRALGLFDDNIETLTSAVAYLMSYQNKEMSRVR